MILPEKSTAQEEEEYIDLQFNTITAPSGIKALFSPGLMDTNGGKGGERDDSDVARRTLNMVERLVESQAQSQRQIDIGSGFNQPYDDNDPTCIPGWKS
ncbi:hypothetical protein FRX31_022201 [Thalictrum thalictroides]|uniref:Uncharacterized protein n=1 Tax=Thalictrum thalictroides TaxID=46969 RepID=A0A7J6VUZ1_THATH|nr:hypothetical protein FRX31_022201 [Thalictrum thalictroides]